jgi:hypothetical protein
MGVDPLVSGDLVRLVLLNAHEGCLACDADILDLLGSAGSSAGESPGDGLLGPSMPPPLLQSRSYWRIRDFADWLGDDQRRLGLLAEGGRSLQAPVTGSVSAWPSRQTRLMLLAQFKRWSGSPSG